MQVARRDLPENSLCCQLPCRDENDEMVVKVRSIAVIFPLKWGKPVHFSYFSKKKKTLEREREKRKKDAWMFVCVWERVMGGRLGGSPALVTIQSVHTSTESRPEIFNSSSSIPHHPTQPNSFFFLIHTSHPLSLGAESSASSSLPWLSRNEEGKFIPLQTTECDSVSARICFLFRALRVFASSHGYK